MNRYEQQFKKGVLEMLVLQRIAFNSTYGYDLRIQLKELSGGLFQLKEGTLYPVLYRLEDDGLIFSAPKMEKTGYKEKKYYSITEKGKQLLILLKGYWEEFSKAVTFIMEEKGEDENG